MSNDLHVLPHQAVERLVLEALLATGMRIDAAALLAQGLSRSDRVAKLLSSWTTWSTTNCLSCVYSPGSCPFFEATESVTERHAVMASIETEPFSCPARREEP